MLPLVAGEIFNILGGVRLVLFFVLFFAPCSTTASSLTRTYKQHH